MRYNVYCDESRHDGPHAHRYMAIGGLWIAHEYEAALRERFQSLCRSYAAPGELKWSKLKALRLQLYHQIVDLFFDSPEASYRAIVVDQFRVDLARYHQGDGELGFYKFYYEMLEKWILPGHEYGILLDQKQNRDPHRYPTMQRFLTARARKVQARVAELSEVNSAEEPAVQICDILTGALAACCCDDLRPDSPKAALAAYIAKRAGFHTLKNSSLSPRFSKFNVFRIEL